MGQFCGGGGERDWCKGREPHTKFILKFGDGTIEKFILKFGGKKSEDC